MVHNSYIRCKVCKSITRVRLQVGWLERHPIIIACGTCGVSLSGKVNIGQMQPSLNFDFENAEILNDEDIPDYIVECSGEFPTSKHCVEEESFQYGSTPFMTSLSRMSDDGYEKFVKSVKTFIRTASRWKDFKRIIDLTKKGNREYLVQEIRKVFPENIMPCRNEFEIMRAIHMLEVQGFLSPLRGDLLEDLSISSDILKLNIIELTKLIDYLNNHDGYGLIDLQALIYKVLDDFIKNYQALIPAFSIQFYQDAAIDYDVEGSSTSDFNSVKQFYLDAYEALGNLMILPVALNNIKYRGNFESVQPMKEKVKKLDDFIAATKGMRYQFCDTNEVYVDKLNLKVDSKLRNAIGHNDVEYCTITQQITYIPDPKDRSKKKTKYLLEFENEAIHLIQAIVVTSEYLYRLREVELIIKGHTPVIPYEPQNVSSKIGRNEPCPCGSGKKYKKCCLSNG